MYCGLMKRVAARPPTVPTMVTTAISHLKRATALNTRRQSTPVSGWANPWPNPVSAPMGGAAAGATAGSEEPACRGSGLVLIGTRTSTVMAGGAGGGGGGGAPRGRAARGGAVDAPSLWQVRYRAARSLHSLHAANRRTAPGGRMHLGAGATPRNTCVTCRIRCRCAENRCRCGLATGWPEPCVGGGQPEIEDVPMSIPLAQDGVPPSVEGREASAMLAIGPEAKARVRILVVDDEHTLRESCAAVLRHEGYDVTVCSRGQEALDLLKRRAFDLVLVDLYMSQVDGLTLLRTALGTNHDTMVIVMTGNPSVESSVEALRQGAFDYLPKPFSASHLQVLIGRAVHTLLVARETREQRDTLDQLQVHSDKITLLGTAPSFRRAIELARKVAPTDASVFITGESGSGKEMIAQ